MVTVGHIHELSRNPQLLPGFANASFQHRAHVQLIADFTENIRFGFALNAKQDVRPGTRSPGTLASALISSSAIPSLKYSSFLFPLMLTNGRTATDLAGGLVRLGESDDPFSGIASPALRSPARIGSMRPLARCQVPTFERACAANSGSSANKSRTAAAASACRPRCPHADAITR